MQVRLMISAIWCRSWRANCQLDLKTAPTPASKMQNTLRREHFPCKSKSASFIHHWHYPGGGGVCVCVCKRSALSEAGVLRGIYLRTTPRPFRHHQKLVFASRAYNLREFSPTTPPRRTHRVGFFIWMYAKCDGFFFHQRKINLGWGRNLLFPSTWIKFECGSLRCACVPFCIKEIYIFRLKIFS
jgi:hypothetical protein